MAKKLASQLRGASIVTDRGLVLGQLHDMLIDEISGRIQMLVASKTPKQLLQNLPKDESGNSLIPYSLVVSIKDNVVINEQGFLQISSKTQLSFK